MSDSPIHSIRLNRQWQVDLEGFTQKQMQKASILPGLELPLNAREIFERLRREYDRPDDEYKLDKYVLRFQRSFSTPSGISEDQAVHLRIKSLPTPGRIFLNGELLGAAENRAVVIEIGRLLKLDFRKNSLIFEFDFEKSTLSRSDFSGTPIGEISLEICSRNA